MSRRGGRSTNGGRNEQRGEAVKGKKQGQLSSGIPPNRKTRPPKIGKKEEGPSDKPNRGGGKVYVTHQFPIGKRANLDQGQIHL